MLNLPSSQNVSFLIDTKVSHDTFVQLFGSHAAVFISRLKEVLSDDSHDAVASLIVSQTNFRSAMRELSTRRNLLVQRLSFIFSFSPLIRLSPAMIRKTTHFRNNLPWPRSGRTKLGKRRRRALLPPGCRILLSKLLAKYGLFQPGSSLFSHDFQPGSGFSPATIGKPPIFQITCLWRDLAGQS
jgi:hypothetical protein